MKNTLYLFAILLFVFQGCDKSLNAPDASNNGGKGGSLARFTIAANHLYTVDAMDLKIYDLSSPATPKFKNKVSIGWRIETIYPFKDKLFIGSNNAMYIYDISNPTDPKKLSETTHVNACDPVVANDNNAFVTVRTGNACIGSINELQVFDITTITSPIKLNTLSLFNPHGLALNGNILYVCDASDGLKVIDITIPTSIKIDNVVKGYTFLDCIAIDNQLICMVSDGLVIYDISDPMAPAFVEKF